MKIYTKTGDSGTTSLFGGKRVDKNSLRIEAYGNVDELNSLLGVILAENPTTEISKKLTRIQNELFVLGANLSTPSDIKIKIPRVSKTFITRLEKEIDEWSKKLPQLKKFILTGGSRIGAKLHLARTVARRVERSIVALSNEEKISKQSLRSSSFDKLRTAGLKNAQIYINRLSDWLFVLARYVNKLENQKETIWKGRG